MQPPLSHKLPRDPTSRPPENPSAAFSQLRTSLIKVLRNSPESREPICDALELIENLQQGMESKRNPDQPPARDMEAPQEYVVQETGDGPYLAERRAGAQPFRCPKPVYDAAAQLLAAAEAPVHFDELQAQLNQATGSRQADYRLRVCLRFWVARGLLQRNRTRYVAVKRETFERDTQDLWQTTRSANS